ncbi:MAG TPA: alpha/beta hydrolase [Acidimicrobiales bacterium]|nr:alpha/beta hydrolase [Acidimicrobiales bacterium]
MGITARVPLRLRVLGVGAVTALLAVACSGNSGSSPPVSGGRPPASTAATPTTASPRVPLTWTPCGGPYQCAKLPVPLSYAHPAGPTIDLALIRLPATNPGARVGELVVNPGGPGASGVRLVRQDASLFSPALRRQFDIIGFDPRGVGESAPVHCQNGDALTRFLDLNPAPVDPAGVTALARASRQFAQSCLAGSGRQLLANVGTVNAARDMDRIRAALGQPKLTFLGFSYGTFLGATYAEEFPTRIRAMVLDGGVDPALGALQSDLQQGQGFEGDLHDFLAHCGGDATCPLNGDPGGAQAAFTKALARIRRGPPLPTGGPRRLHAGEGYLGIVAALYDRSTWPVLAQGLDQVLHGTGTTLLALSDAYTERQPDGTYTNTTAADTAITCADQPAPRNLSAYQAAAARFAKVAPTFGELEAYASLVCAYWPIPPTGHPHPLRAPGSPPIVVVGTTGDPATPYGWAVALAHQLEHGVLLTHVGVGHTAYGDSGCVRHHVDAYLINLTVPPPGTVCHG